MLLDYQSDQVDGASGTDRTDSQSCAPGHLGSNPRELIERIQSGFIESLQPALTDLLLTAVTADVVHSAQAPLSKLLDSGLGTGCLALLDLAPVPCRAVVRFAPNLLFRVLDTLLSAPPDAASKPRGPVTEIEIHILNEFFQMFAEKLRAAWAPVLPMSFELIAAGTDNVRKVASSSASDIAVIVTSRIRIGESDEIFEVAIPGFAARLAEINSRESLAKAGAAEPSDPGLLSALSRARLHVETVLRGSSIQMKDLLAMRPGQIFLLKTPLEASFDCLVNGKAHFTGHMIANGSRHGFQIASDSAGVSK